MNGGAAVVVREARPEEHEALGELTVEAYRSAGETDEPYYSTLRDVAARAAVVPILVAVDAASGELLGGVTYVPGPGPWNDSDRADHATFRMLAVAPSARGRGVGRALVEACVGQARADGRAGIEIVTRPFMVTAHRLYERLGFVRDADADWEFEPGERLLAYRLTL